MNQLNDKIVIIDPAGDMHRGVLTVESKSKLKALMHNLLSESAEEADQLERPVRASTLMRVYREKVDQL